MIEQLDGIYETVVFQRDIGIRINYMDVLENFPAHWHTPVEMILCTGNWYGVTVGGRDYRLREGDVAIIRPGAIHALTAPERGSRTIFLADTAVIQKTANLETLLALLPPVTRIRPEDSGTLYAEVRRILSEIEAEYAGAGPYHELLIYAKLMELLALLGRFGVRRLETAGELTDPYPTKNAARFLEICDYINAHCTEELPLDEIARLAGFSKYHFSRLFKDFTHTTYYKYLNKKRIAHAEDLLTNPEYSVTEVALQSGFASLSSFIRMFRQLKGCTPTEFRNMYSPNGAIHLNGRKGEESRN